MTVAPRTMSGPPASIDAFIEVAAERFVGARRVRADDGGRVGERREPLEDDGVGRNLRMGHEGAEARPAVRLDPAKVVEPVDGDDALRSGALPWRAPTTRSVPPATGRAPLASAPPRPPWPPRGTRRSLGLPGGGPDTLGGHRQLPDPAADDLRDRVRDCSGVGTVRLADALRPQRSTVFGRRLDPGDIDAGASAAVTSL